MFNTIGKILGIKYLYEDEMAKFASGYENDQGAIVVALAKLPGALVLKMHEALSVADLDLFVEHIQSVELHDPELARELLMRARNYDYEYLNQLLKVKENNDE